MSDVSLHTYFAVEAPLSTFFIDTGERMRVCRRDSRHEVGEKAKFCPECGHEISLQALTKPAPEFKAFCDQNGASPEEAFVLLRDGAWEWKDDDGVESYTIGWHRVQTRDEAEINEGDLVWALGVKLQEHWLEGRENAPKLLCYSVKDMEILSKALSEICEKFQIKGTPKLYVQAYLSY